MEDCDAIGHPLPGTQFIAFKVPLKGVVNQRLSPTQKFTPKDLISAIKALNVELGLITDLTYTTRYYEVKDLPKSIHYKKNFTLLDLKSLIMLLFCSSKSGSESSIGKMQKMINLLEFIVLMKLTEQDVLYVGTLLMLKAGIQI